MAPKAVEVVMHLYKDLDGRRLRYVSSVLARGKD